MQNANEATMRSNTKPGNQVIRLLRKERDNLEKRLEEAERRIEQAPEGSVQVKKHKKGVQFYFRSSPQEKKLKYLPSAERPKAIALIQKMYDKRIISSAEQQINCIERFLNHYDPDALKKVFWTENPERQKLLKAVDVPDELFIDEWLAADFTPKEFYEGSKVHFTSKEEKVRSKSEVLIANSLYRHGIPYRYECPLRLNSRIVYPDFTILRASDRKEFYWEHLGMMDDTEYRNHAFMKIQSYERMGIFPGEKLILTIETYKLPLNQKTINNVIRHYFL
ncbi:MAG: hypothetical protein IJ121_12685 [Eubacterium sp.]|nr:hypothetical protein [Eubacterium sp.]